MYSVGCWSHTETAMGKYVVDDVLRRRVCSRPYVLVNLALDNKSRGRMELKICQQILGDVLRFHHKIIRLIYQTDRLDHFRHTSACMTWIVGFLLADAWWVKKEWGDCMIRHIIQSDIQLPIQTIDALDLDMYEHVAICINVVGEISLAFPWQYDQKPESQSYSLCKSTTAPA